MSKFELWMPIKGYEHSYAISDRGNVLSLRQGRKPARIIKRSHGSTVNLYDRGHQKTCYVDRLVYEAFAKKELTPGNWYLVHKDGDPCNCALDNLVRVKRPNFEDYKNEVM